MYISIPLKSWIPGGTHDHHDQFKNGNCFWAPPCVQNTTQNNLMSSLKPTLSMEGFWDFLKDPRTALQLGFINIKPKCHHWWNQSVFVESRLICAYRFFNATKWHFDWTIVRNFKFLKIQCYEVPLFCRIMTVKGVSSLSFLTFVFPGLYPGRYRRWVSDRRARNGENGASEAYNALHAQIYFLLSRSGSQ